MESQVRIRNEMKNMVENHSEDLFAYPLENNPLNWHFSIKGPKNTEFEGGFYHGILDLQNNYPENQPVIQFVTPNGRFQVNTALCLYTLNNKKWQTEWTLINLLEALINYMPIQESHTGSISESKEKRVEYAKNSSQFKCKQCGLIIDHIKGNVKENQ